MGQTKKGHGIYANSYIDTIKITDSAERNELIKNKYICIFRDESTCTRFQFGGGGGVIHPIALGDPKMY